MNEPKLLPPDHPDAPKYWMYEIGGELQPAVKAYLNGERLNDRQLKLMRDYVYLWVSSPVWAGSGVLEALRLRVAAVKSQEDLDGAIRHAVSAGMDPL